mmetsp:Transcript_125404/g.287256  ORF Transcript_125404/g.287256 Transcript_125404/m.287256 type:complete len:109 (+) Transcript_125404:404-730(+)
MLDHIILFRFLNTPPVFRAGFYGGFVALVAALQLLEKKEAALGILSEGHSQDNDGHAAPAPPREKVLEKLSDADRHVLRGFEGAVMFAEYGLFTSFVCGMAAGLSRKR